MKKKKKILHDSQNKKFAYDRLKALLRLAYLLESEFLTIMHYTAAKFFP